MTTETLHEIGDYVTAYASDLADPAIVGQVLVMANSYVEWDERAQEEVVVDATGSYRVRPNGATRVGSAGPRDHVTLGTVIAPMPRSARVKSCVPFSDATAGVLEEVTWWTTEEVLRMSPEAFADELAAFWPS